MVDTDDKGVEIDQEVLDFFRISEEEGMDVESSGARKEAELAVMGEEERDDRRQEQQVSLQRQRQVFQQRHRQV